MHSLLPGGRRGSIRLYTHDYAAHSTYFLTLCTYRRAPIFGHISDGIVRLSVAGRVVEDLWVQTPQLRAGVVLDAFVIMPDHMHAIVTMPAAGRVEASCGLLHRAPGSLGSLVAGYKASCTSEVRRVLERPQLRLWQRNYHERVVRNGPALDRIRRYIAANPARWRTGHGDH
jgi:putative transposase